MTNELPPLTLYIHLPWCVRKCPYCDFNSHSAASGTPFDDYVAAVIEDIATEADRAGNRSVDSIYLGGGTPSLFRPVQIACVLEAARKRLHVAKDCEISMEVNPGALERGDLGGFRAAGVTRLSIGAQSFDPAQLKVLGRIHSPDDIVAAFDEANSAGFDSINIDLMFALPGQTVDAAAADIEQVCRLSPPHVSYYQLTLEPNTEFFRKPPAGLPDDGLAWRIQERCQSLLRDSGYEQYEVSAFARDGHRCRHNLNYWTFGDYLAVGAGAHGKYTDDAGVIRRYRKPAHPRTFIEDMRRQAPAPAAAIAERDTGFEYLLNALRLTAGFSEASFTARTGLGFDVIETPLEKAQQDGLVRRLPDGVWQPTALGFRFLNDLQARFLP